MSEPAAGLDELGVPTYSVAELAGVLNGVLRREFDDGVWVRGEVSGMAERGPHQYFRLVERDGDALATLHVSFFAPNRRRLRPMLERHRLRLVDGVKVRIFGHLDYYAPTGRLGLTMTDLDPRFTLGELALERGQLVQRLVATGKYDANRRRRLAPVPLRVGVVASLDSAAWADFRHALERSGFGFHLRVHDVRVQGDQAVAQVSRAIARLGAADDLDVVVVIRGGGARTELATFDAEPIALAIADASLPVFTGLGHEIDRSVADEVAHTALTTPTACAGALIEHVQRAVDDLDQLRGRLGAQAIARLHRAEERLAGRADRVRSQARRATEHAARDLDRIEQHVRLLDPVHTLARGWSITRTADGRTVRSARQLAPGDRIVTTFADGSADSTVGAVSPAPAET